MPVFSFRYLLFSDRKVFRMVRHLLFWTIICLNFLIEVIYPEKLSDLLHRNIYEQAFSNLICYLPIGIFSVYAGIYYLIPRYFQTKKYFLFAIGLLLLLCLDFALSFYATGVYFILLKTDIRYTTFLHTLDLGYLFTIWILTVTVWAIGIKLAKRWYLQQQENLEISRRKARLELQLEKANIQPAFIFQTLESINGQLHTDNALAAGMVIGLSDILSYSLYDSDAELVPLDLELSYLYEFIKLQKVCDEQLQIAVTLTPAVHDTYIAPMVLLTLLQECISMQKKQRNNAAKMVIHICVAEGRLVILFSTKYDIEKGLTRNDDLQNAGDKIKKMFSSAGYEIKNAVENNEIRIRLTVSLITDPYQLAANYNHQPEERIHETA